MKIYTKTGDKGETSLFGGGRVRKNHARVEAYGTIDELNAALGVALSAGPPEPINQWLREVQGHLFHLGSDLATPLDSKTNRATRIAQSQVSWLEDAIDQMTAQLEPLRNFILPGGTPVAAQLHVARTVCRRAERQIVALQETSETNALAVVYINRLSDWLFTLARYENALAGESERKWSLQS
ncbi:MAG: cob(I)yrinic acid a,c-diamide adenosyltransferase [Chloroflexota bacterium]|nr:cob(I)yrinic acid a,c-diamide adenosyltransferase [Chloroflexota bacterium]